VKGSSGQTVVAGAAAADSRAAVAARLAGALIAGLIWYPYRVLRDGGVEALAPRECFGGAIIVAASLFTARRAGASPG